MAGNRVVKIEVVVDSTGAVTGFRKLEDGATKAQNKLKTSDSKIQSADSSW